MKKIINIVMVLLIVFAFTGCSNDEEYIESVKGITFDNGETVKDIVNDYLLATDLVIRNEGRIKYTLSKDSWDYNATRLEFKGSRDSIPSYEMYFERIAAGANTAGYEVLYDEPEYNWVIEGKTSTGRIIIVTSKYGKMKMTTIDDGDYITMYKNSIKAVPYKGNKIVGSFDRRMALLINRCVIKFMDDLGV